MATTIRQVAAAAGVSIATASRALSGSSMVIDATKQRVLQVAAELDYTPSRLAQSLATGSTGNIGVVLPDVTNPFYTSFLSELESAAATRDMGVLVGDSHEEPDLEYLLVRRMTSQVDALVLASSRLPDDAILAAAKRLPVVLANRRLDAQTLGAEMLGAETSAPYQLSQVTIDVEPGFGDAVRHLYELGHRTLVYLDGPSRSWSGQQKCATLARICTELDMELRVIPTPGSPDFTSGRRALAHLGVRAVSAVLTFNDQMALGLLSVLREAGVSVPDEVSVIGCDDSLPEGLAWPALTTIDSSPQLLGSLAAQAILDPKSCWATSIPSRLVIRESTAALLTTATTTATKESP